MADLPCEELFEANVALEVAEKDVCVLDVHSQDVHRLVTLRAGQIQQSQITIVFLILVMHLNHLICVTLRTV